MTQIRDLLSLAAYCLRQRGRLNRVRAVLRAGDDERVMHEAQLAYLRRHASFADARSSPALVRDWTNVLIEAAEKVERDRRDAELYAAVAAEETAEDREWADAARHVAGERWKES
ncbi:MAG TPA: hypothetical protein VF101_19495 [Gaiellaceae bacterium]